MPQSYRKVITSEFIDMMKQRKNLNYSSFSIDNVLRESDLDGEEDENTILPIPDYPNLMTENDLVLYGQKNLGYGIIKGISEPYFSELNNCEVEIAKQKVFYKRLSMYDENNNVVFRKDKDGNFVTKEIYLESGFIGVFSTKNIHLPNRIEKHGVKKEYIPTDGYGYIDYAETPNCRKYLYTVPMEAVYHMQLCALVLSLERKEKVVKKFFKGCSVALKNGFYAHLFVVPYENIARAVRRTENMYGEGILDISHYKILCMKPSTNFNEEVRQLLNLWKQEDKIFDLEKTVVTDSEMYTKENFGIIDIEPNLEVSDFRRIGEPMKQLELDTEEVESEESE